MAAPGFNIHGWGFIFPYKFHHSALEILESIEKRVVRYLFLQELPKLFHWAQVR